MAAAGYPGSSGPQLQTTMDQCDPDTGNIGSQVRQVTLGRHAMDLT